MKKSVNRHAEIPNLWVITGLIALTFGAYSNALSGDYIWDDQFQVLRNAQIRDFSNIPHAFTTAVLAFAHKAFEHSNYYRPLHTVGYMVAYSIGGIAPWPYHLLNIALHAIATVFVYLLCRELRLSSFASILAGAIFAVHPIHTEVVAWIAGLPDAGCGAFYLISLWAYLRHVRLRKPAWLGVSAFAFLVALLFKEMAITLPAVILALMVYDGRVFHRKIRDIVLELGPYALVAAVYLGMRFAVFGFVVTTHVNIQASTWDWISLGVHAFGQYIRYSLVPYPLAAFHLIPTHFADRIAITLLYGIITLIACVAVWLARKRIPAMPLWLVVFAVMLVPVFYFKGISLTYFAERYLYTPSIAVAVVLALVIDCLKRSPKFIVSGILILLFTAMTLQRNQDWTDSESLYNATLRVYPEAVVFRINLAETYVKANRDSDARFHLEQALAHLQNSIYFHPANEDARVYLNLAAIAARKMEYTQARDYLKKALQINPESGAAYVYLGGVMMESEKDFESAMSQFKKAMELEPLNEVAYDYMGAALFNLARYPEALKYFQEALTINPANNEVKSHLIMVNEILKAH